MRLFLAIELPKQVTEAISQLQQELHVQGVRPAKDPHLTLHFIGNKSEEECADIIEKLKLIEHNEFSLTTAGISCFPSDHYIRTIYLQVKPNQPVQSLRKKILNLRVFEGVVDKTQFIPHITIARVKFVNDKEKLVKQIENLMLNHYTWNIERFVLYSSELSKDGPTYQEIVSYPLKKNT